MRERRFKRSRKPHKVFLVVCEGETEENYVEFLRQHYRLPITIKTKVSGNAVNRRLVNQYVKELGLQKDDDCRIFFIYDADVACVAERLLALPGEVVLSNPSFELWFLLHSRELTRTVSSEELTRMLISCSPIWRSYEKGKLSQEQRRHLATSYREAMSRAKTLKWHENPSSNMHLFIEALEAEKR